MEQEKTPAAERDAKGVSSPRFWLPFSVTVITVAVMAATIALMMNQLRERLHAGILDQDSMVLEAAAAAQEGLAEGSPQERLKNLVEISKLREEDMFGMRLFDPDGKFIIGLSKDLRPADLSPEFFEKLQVGKPFGRFVPEMDLSTQFLPGVVDKIIAPILIATVPIKTSDGKIAGGAEFLLNGVRIQRQLREVDREVRQSALWFSLGGGLVILVVLSWAFHRLNRANRLLAERTANLLRANHELTMAAKTSALGAVAAHLIHGLKNPLFGLQTYVSMRAEEANGGEWKVAADTARRMQLMIADVVRILREEEGSNAYEVSTGELSGLLKDKVAPISREASVKLITDVRAEGALPNREANLVILVVTNLVQNAVQASKTGAKVTVSILDVGDSVCFDVSDEAGGLPKSTLQNLFTPCQTSKQGGTGLGLAISKQLANHMGGQLELIKTGSEGTTFRLAIPRQLFQGANPVAADAVA